jgi:hypothetical protein
MSVPCNACTGDAVRVDRCVTIARASRCTMREWGKRAKAKGCRERWLKRSHHSGAHGDGDVHAKCTTCHALQPPNVTSTK